VWGSPRDGAGSGVRMEKEYQDWKAIYAVQQEGGALTREHIGYLEHTFTIEDPEGTWVVYDAQRRPVGFVLPSGKAYRYERDTFGRIQHREIGQEGLDRGVMKLLGASGAVEYSEVGQPGSAGSS